MTKISSQQCFANARRVSAQPLRVTSVLNRYRSAAGLQAPMQIDDTSPRQPIDEPTRVLNLLTACRTGKLGSHTFHCGGCGRNALSLNKCTNRHCTACGYERRAEWEQSVAAWLLPCDHLHVVFTLPSQLRPLVKSDEAQLLKLFGKCCSDVLRQASEELGCKLGTISALHTWGQRMNYHVHQHAIVSAGGPAGGPAGGSSQGEDRWASVSRDAPELAPCRLADRLRDTFLRRIRRRLKSGKLAWPAWIGGDPSEYLAKLARMQWGVHAKANCDYNMGDNITGDDNTGDDNTGDDNTDASLHLVRYLARYIAGTAIGNGRIIDDDGRFVKFEYKDYRTGQKCVERIPGVEFTQRFHQHIWPRCIRKVRYGGIYVAAGRKERLDGYRPLIQAARRSETVDSVAGAGGEQFPGQPLAGDSLDEETLEPESSTGATCRHCSGPLVATSYFKGTPTMHLMAVACALVGLLPELADAAIAVLRDKLPLLSRESLWRRDLKSLPRDLQDLMLDAPYRYDFEHTDALFAAIDLYRAARPP